MDAQGHSASCLYARTAAAVLLQRSERGDICLTAEWPSKDGWDTLEPSYGSDQSWEAWQN